MKDFKISYLNDIYGGLLTERQSEILKDYYDFDLSYGEIAESLSITRQAVGQVIEASTKQLESFDAELNLLGILTELKSLKQDIKDKSVITRLDVIISLISNKTEKTLQ